MSVLIRNVSKKQRAWLVAYEASTGFEPMYQDGFAAGEITFADFSPRQ